MWIFLPDAFFSIVEDRASSELLLVRARIQGDLERYFPRCRVIETPFADYRFRASALRSEVADVVLAAATAITYDNFKNQVAKDDTLRKHAYMGVWDVMNRAQQEAVGNRKLLRTKTTKSKLAKNALPAPSSYNCRVCHDSGFIVSGLASTICRYCA